MLFNKFKFCEIVFLILSFWNYSNGTIQKIKLIYILINENKILLNFYSIFSNHFYFFLL